MLVVVIQWGPARSTFDTPKSGHILCGGNSLHQCASPFSLLGCSHPEATHDYATGFEAGGRGPSRGALCLQQAGQGVFFAVPYGGSLWSWDPSGRLLIRPCKTCYAGTLQLTNPAASLVDGGFRHRSYREHQGARERAADLPERLVYRAAGPFLLAIGGTMAATTGYGMFERVPG